MNLHEYFPTYIDYEGQRLTDRLSKSILVIFAVIGFIYGYIEQKMSYTVISIGIGFCIASLLTIPPWPIYRKHPLQWQKVQKKESPKKKK